MVNVCGFGRLGMLAVGLGLGVAVAYSPAASADSSSDWLAPIDNVLAGAALPAPSSGLDLAISFDGYSLVSDGSATATTVAGQYGLAIAYGDGATATAEGGYGDSALASGTYALADAGSKTPDATGFNFDSAADIGNNVDPSTYTNPPDGAYAGGGSLIGGVDTGVSANDTAQFLGNGGLDTDGALNGGHSGAFAGDSGLIGEGGTAGSGDTAYTSGNINGFGDGSAAVGGNSDSAYTTGTETGSNEGALTAFGNYDSATADNNYTLDGSEVSASYGNGNYAFVDGPVNSTALAGGNFIDPSNSNIAYIEDPFGSTADSAIAGGNGLTTGGNDLAEVLFTHGDASAVGNLLYDVVSLLGNASGSF
jgi:hypothetical protein